IGGWLLGESSLLERHALGRLQECIDHTKVMEGKRSIAARTTRHMRAEPLLRHLRDELERCAHELVEAAIELVRRQLRRRSLVEPEEVDDLLGALREGEPLPAREHWNRAHSKRLELGLAGRVFQN